jgi:hypothetical protein
MSKTGTIAFWPHPHGGGTRRRLACPIRRPAESPRLVVPASAGPHFPLSPRLPRKFNPRSHLVIFRNVLPEPRPFSRGPACSAVGASLQFRNDSILVSLGPILPGSLVAPLVTFVRHRPCSIHFGLFRARAPKTGDKKCQKVPNRAIQGDHPRLACPIRRPFQARTCNWWCSLIFACAEEPVAQPFFRSTGTEQYRFFRSC